MRIGKWAILVLLLAACSALGGEPAAQNAGDVTSGGDNHPIQWNRDPYYVVFRADVVGGDDADAFYRKNEVPPCTIYGDNRVVWTVENSEGSAQVLWDRLSDEVIREFVSDLTVNFRFYTYKSRAGEEITTELPVMETLTLGVNDVIHTSDSFSDWPPDYYADILEKCQSLSQTPVLFEPEGAWIIAEPVIYEPAIPSVIWDADATGLDLNILAENGAPEWHTDNNVRLLWNLIHDSTPDTQFTQGVDTFLVAVQVPGVTRDAPPPPAQ